MNCVVGGTNIKVLAKAIHALARIGEDLFIESLPIGLVLRTVNSSRSAYVCFTFMPDFFAEYKDHSETKCKVSLKSCMMAFRSLPSMEKTVEKCVLDITSNDCMLRIKFVCKHDLTKIYQLPLIENETVQASFQKQRNPCELTAQTRLLSDGIQNFSNAVDEVTLTVTAQQVTLKNYIDNDLEQSKVVHTELTLEAQEFDDYTVEQNVDVTFCLKELKAILGFAEGCAVTISCQNGGKPIMFTIEGIYGVESEFVLATLADKANQIANTQGSSVSVSQDQERLVVNNTNKRYDRKGKGKNSAYNNLITSSREVASTSGLQAISTGSQKPSTSNGVPDVIVNLDDEADNDDFIPSTPPSKKFRSQFLGLLSNSQYTSMMPESEEVLAENSEED